MNQEQSRLENHTTHKDATCTVTLVSGSVDSNGSSKHLLFVYCIAEDYHRMIEGWADSRHTHKMKIAKYRSLISVISVGVVNMFVSVCELNLHVERAPTCCVAS